MDARKLQLTYLVTKIAEAVAMDETVEAGGCDLSAGMFGPNMSDLIRDIVDLVNGDETKLVEEAAIPSREVFNAWVAVRTGTLFAPGAASSDFYYEIFKAGALATLSPKERS